MSKMEWCLLDSRKKEHEEIISAISELGRIGYLVKSAGFKDDALEIVCYPPRDKEDSDESSSSRLSVDGVSESF